MNQTGDTAGTKCVRTAAATAAIGLGGAGDLAADPVVAGRMNLSLQTPAAEWVEGLPMANGISAAMIWGAPARTVISLNHVDFWRHDLNLDELPDLSPAMTEVRELMLSGKPKEANDLFYNKVYGQLHNMPRQRVAQSSGYTNAFAPVGDIVIELEGQEKAGDYLRELNLHDGIVRISYRAGDKGPVRIECFIPLREDVIIFGIQAAQPVSGRVFFARPPEHEYQWSSTTTHSALRVRGRYAEGVESALAASIQADGERESANMTVLKADVAGQRSDVKPIERLSGAAFKTEGQRSDALRFDGVTNLELRISVESGRERQNLPAVAEKKLAETAKRNLSLIRQDHIREHAAMFDRVALSLDGAGAHQPMTSEHLINEAVQGRYDNQLAELTFQFGRYLMMSCNRAGRRPANLQGIWNRDPYAPWDADWHLDMNIEMNQWLCNPANLNECNLPFFQQMERFIPQGRMIARRMAGADGILFYGVAGGDGMNWSAEGGFWCGAAPWIAQHFWEHYKFTLDREFLAKHAYPFLKEVGLFYRSWLVKNPAGKYVTGFSFSPENTPPNGFVNNVHCTMDTAQVREVTAHLLEAGRILDQDRELWPIWQDLHDHVLSYPVASSGELKEWPQPISEQPAHRHFSHLLPLFPGNAFTRDGTPELFEAARRAVLLRERHSDAWVSWSFPYAACFHARLGEGDNALRNLLRLSQKNTVNNLLTFHPDWGWGYRLFQIEANFGATAAIAEMLVQSHEGFIRLLPALPGQWATGHFRGLQARGAFVIDCEWKTGKVTQAAVHSLKGIPCALRNMRPWAAVEIRQNGQKVDFTLEAGSQTIRFPTQMGASYELRFE